MTQLEYAKNNIITPLAKKISVIEGISAGIIMERIKSGRVVITQNRMHEVKKPCAIGYGLRTKINVNIGTSPDRSEAADELKKLAMAVKYGADTVMDLSVGGNIAKIRKRILDISPLPVGTVPVYEIAVNAQKSKGDFLNFGTNEILDVLQSQAEDGVDFFTIHAGVTLATLGALQKEKRVLGIVSRGGAILAGWIHRYNKENPFYESFDRVLDIASKYDITLSLGDGLRPGSILDATDAAQVAELNVLGELAVRARKKNVQVIIEGPGHVPLSQIKENIELEKKICRKAPFYVLGPLVTDVGAGYDHITASIGGAMAAAFGADFLCFVTPSEHLRHPSVEDVREGTIASRIAAHAADIAKGVKSAVEWDKEITQARRKRDWKRQVALSVDPDKARAYHTSSRAASGDVCTMCGRYCSIKVMEECMRA